MLKKIILVILAMVFVAGINGFCQESKSIDVLMGKSIQKYLEGDIKESMVYLNELLLQQPDNARAQDLLKKATDRLMEKVVKVKDYKSGLDYLKRSQKHIRDYDPLQKNIEKLQELMGIKRVIEKKTEKTEVKAPDTVKKKPHKRTVRDTGKIRQLTSRINKLEKQLAAGLATRRHLQSLTDELKKERELLNERLNEKVPPILSGWMIAGIVLLFIGAVGFIYLTFKSGIAGLTRNVIKERRSVEDLKTTYNKDTEKLAQVLAEYGKSSKRTDDMEKNWEKIIKILDKLSQGGSLNKFILHDSPDGRKAVTGVDPRPRARADSVEVIAEIFKDSPKATEMLKPFLNDNDNRTRANAAVAYYRYDPEKSVVVLQDMADSDDKWMRISAAWALGAISDSATSHVLEKLLDDPDDDVKNKARISLEKILGNAEKHT